MSANRCPGRVAARSGLVMEAAIMARTTLWRARTPASRTSVAYFFSLTMDQVADLSHYRPDAFRLDLDHMPDQVKALMAGSARPPSAELITDLMARYATEPAGL